MILANLAKLAKNSQVSWLGSKPRGSRDKKVIAKIAKYIYIYILLLVIPIANSRFYTFLQKIGYFGYMP